jgi:hypothetical protein
MAAQVSQSGLSFDAGASQEISQHVHDPIMTGIDNLPPGILGGVVKVTRCRFEKVPPGSTRKKFDGTSAEGQAQFVISGVVMEPASIVHPKTGQTVRVAGRQSRPFPIPCYDNKRAGKLATKTDMILRSMNEMKSIVNNQFLFCNPDKSPKVVTAELLEATALAIEQASMKKPIYVRFDTSEGEISAANPNPMTFENWRGSQGLEGYTPPSFAAMAVQDDNRPAPGTTATFVPAQQSPTVAAPATAQTQVAAPATVTDALFADTSGEDVVTLVKHASGDEADPQTRTAMNRLAEIAVSVGIPMGEAGVKARTVSGSESWTELGRWIVENQKAAPHANGQAPTGPKKDDMWKFTKVPMVDLKTRVPLTNPDGTPRFRKVDAVVTTVHGDGTFDLLNFDDQKTVYSKVPLADLEAV